MFCQVAVNIPSLTGVFDYTVPPELVDSLKPGCLVAVPFGKQLAQGVVVALMPTSEVQLTRPLHALLDPAPVLTHLQLRLAQRLAYETLAPISQCIDLFIPPGLSQHADTLYQLLEFPPAAGFQPTSLQQRILAEMAERRALRGRQLDAAFPHQNWKAAAQGLVKKGWLMARPVLPPPSVRPRLVRNAQLAVPIAQALSRAAEISQESTLARRQAALQFLSKETLPVDTAWVYAASGATPADLHRLAEEGLVALGESEMWRDPLEKIEVSLQTPPELTAGQSAAWQQLEASLDASQPRPALLLGVTGSGKTELYLRAAARVVAQGRQVIILVPEISLTPQTVRRFMARFPGRVGLVHSGLSPGERYDTWRRARAGDLPVIVGPRSALFTPLANLGLIVVDECHDDSYAQDDLPPAYHAVSAALVYAELAACPVLLGSATPNVGLVYRARQEGWPIVHLPERILAHRQQVEARLADLGLTAPALPVEGSAEVQPLPPVEVIDMREELKQGNRSIFSAALRAELEAVLAHRQQAILFLNRRGTATYVFCRACGGDLRCPRCDLPLVAHTGEVLVCHTCGYRRQVPKKCPTCGSTAIRQYGTGTEKVETEVRQQFPGARVLRFDSETTRQKGAHEILLAHFASQRADILVGTQMLAKGLDLPLVTLVGVILADVGLSLPDYRAAERTFQLLMQVAGRAGRSPLGGKVVLQTFKPEVYPIQAAATHDYEGFYQRELANRRQIGYPPFSRLVRVESRGDDPEAVERASRSAAVQLRAWIAEGQFDATELIGPVPCYYSRVDGLYRWQVILRGPNPAAILRGKSLGDYRVQVDPVSLL